MSLRYENLVVTANYDTVGSFSLSLSPCRSPCIFNKLFVRDIVTHSVSHGDPTKQTVLFPSMSNKLKGSWVISMYRQVVLAEVMSWNSWNNPYWKLTYPTGSLTTLTGSLIVMVLSRHDLTRVDKTPSFKKSTRLMIPRERMGAGGLKCRGLVTTWRHFTRPLCIAIKAVLY